jgi:hypothetical protein
MPVAAVDFRNAQENGLKRRNNLSATVAYGLPKIDRPRRSICTKTAT